MHKKSPRFACNVPMADLTLCTELLSGCFLHTGSIWWWHQTAEGGTIPLWGHGDGWELGGVNGAPHPCRGSGTIPPFGVLQGAVPAL